MKCLGLSVRPDLCLFSIQNHVFCSFVIEYLYLILHCLSAALLIYIGFQKFSLIRSIPRACSTCCCGPFFQLQNLQLFLETFLGHRLRIFLPVAEASLDFLSN